MHVYSGNPTGEYYPSMPEQLYVPESVITVDQYGTITYATHLVTPTGYYPQPVPPNTSTVQPAMTVGTV